MYQNYHRHSHYSNIITPDSTVTNEDYALRAIELGQGILSSLEHGYSGRSIEVYELAKANNLKFLFGTESYFVKDRLEKDRTNAHLILLAKNENGRRNINRILSEANLTGYYYRARIDLDLLLSLPSNDVWVTTACLGGVWKYDDYEDLILQFKNHFGNNFFLEVQNHNTPLQAELNYKILNMSNKHDIPIIFGCDSHYIDPLQASDRDDYLLSKHVEYEDEKGWFLDYPTEEDAILRFKSQGVLSHSQISEAINNTNIFLDVEEYTSNIFEKKMKLPSVYPDKLQEEKNVIFSNLIWRQWDIEKNNVPRNRWATYEVEIKKEEEIVIETGMADYFLLDYEVVKRGKELGGHITMTGRGSAPSFYISKLLGFTTIDRIGASVKLFPERFITKERILEAGTLPDIDFNLGNPEIFAQAQIDVLGENHSYPMVAYGTLQPKAAWKLYARAKNIDFETANLVSSQIQQYEYDVLKDDEDNIPNVFDYIDQEFHEIFAESKKYLGIVSDAKIHPCGYILYDGDIKEEFGLIKVKTNICAAIDGLWAEKYSFLKNDLLKVSVVELIYRVYQRIGVEPHSFPELLKLCENNQKVWDVYKNSWTMGINQVEQPSTKGRVAKYSPTNISEVSAFVAAIRPGFKSNYKQFEAREDFSYGIESLDKILQTKEFPQSYILYQEQAMLVMAYAGIPISETYEVVKNIAKKRADKVHKYKEQFVDGMTKKVMKSEKVNQYEAEDIAHKTWQIIEDSSRYSFNASHSYSVAGDSLYGAYLKANYPLEFYEIFLNILEEDGDKNRMVRTIEEAQSAFGIIFPPYKFGQDNRAIVAQPKDNAIMASLSSIKGFSKSIGENMYELSQKTYGSFLELLTEIENCGIMSSKLEELIRINYFDIFGGNKKLLEIYKEFTSGKARYSNKHKDDTKVKRLMALQEFANSLPDERMGVYEQITAENNILGNIHVTYPNIDKRFLYVLSVDTKFSPRIDVYCLATGKRDSIKIQKNIYDNNLFYGGEIVYGKHFIKKPLVKYVDGIFEDVPDQYQWWMDSYKVIQLEEFDKMIKDKI
jgi:DNA polymerase III alpha subunit